MKKKLFISHAAEDKVDFVRPLAKALKMHFDVWYDEFELVVGSSLLEEISKGLNATDYGIVVLSPYFFAKKWTQQELNGLFALEEKDRKVILPIWKDVSKSDVREYSPILADRLAVKASEGIQIVVSEIERSIEFFERGKEVQRGSESIKQLSATLYRKAELAASENALKTERGVEIVTKEAQQVITRLADTIAELLKKSPEFDVRIDTPQIKIVHSYVNIWSGNLCLRFEYYNDVINSASHTYMVCMIIFGHWKRFSNFRDANVRQREEYAPFITSDGRVRWGGKNGKARDGEALVDEWVLRYAKEIEDSIG